MAPLFLMASYIPPANMCQAVQDPDGPVVSYPPGLPPRPPARLSFARPDTPMHGSSASSKAPITSEEARGNAGGSTKQKLSKVLGLFSRKRKEAGPASPPLAPPAPPTPPKPIRLHFLFVGSRGTGQTSLLLWETLCGPGSGDSSTQKQGAMANLDLWAQPIALWILPGRECRLSLGRMDTILTRLDDVGTRAKADNVRNVYA